MGTVYFIAVGLGAFWIFPSASPDAIVCATLISSQIEVSCPLQYTRGEDFHRTNAALNDMMREFRCDDASEASHAAMLLFADPNVKPN
jgi:hypothetical protein